MIRLQKNDFNKHISKPTVLINLKMKMILLIGALVIAIVIVIGGFLSYFLDNTLEAQIGERALIVAETVAHMPDLVAAFKADNPSDIIQQIVTPIQQSTGAEFIVVGNQDEIRYAHPNENEIGRKMVGEDNEAALIRGASYTSIATGSLGKSLRAKVPIVLDNEIVGVVSVGFLVDNINTIIWDYSKELWIVLILIAIAAIGVAVLIATHIKKDLFGLEPEEISHLLFQKETILHSTHEGILAVNDEGIITMMNSAAERLLLDEEIVGKQYIGQSIQATFPTSELAEVLKSGKGQYDKENIFGNNIVFVNSVPIYVENVLVGAVSTFRNKTEIELLSKELSRVKQYASALRAQTHEFSNKLYTIMGLVHLNKKKEVIDFIQLESAVQQEWIYTVIEKISDPLLSGLLIGKLNAASEKQIDLMIHEESELNIHLSDKQSQALLTAVGNLIDNAIDAVMDSLPTNRKISIFFTDVGDDILFEIDDSGTGISEVYVTKLFEQGFSTKEGSDRGFGLALTYQLISTIGGQIYVEESELGGSCFIVSIPKLSEGE